MIMLVRPKRHYQHGFLISEIDILEQIKLDFEKPLAKQAHMLASVTVGDRRGISSE